MCSNTITDPPEPVIAAGRWSREPDGRTQPLSRPCGLVPTCASVEPSSDVRSELPGGPTGRLPVNEAASTVNSIHPWLSELCLDSPLPGDDANKLIDLSGSDTSKLIELSKGIANNSIINTHPRLGELCVDSSPQDYGTQPPTDMPDILCTEQQYPNRDAPTGAVNPTKEDIDAVDKIVTGVSKDPVPTKRMTDDSDSIPWLRELWREPSYPDDRGGSSVTTEGNVLPPNNENVIVDSELLAVLSADQSKSGDIPRSSTLFAGSRPWCGEPGTGGAHGDPEPLPPVDLEMLAIQFMEMSMKDTSTLQKGLTEKVCLPSSPDNEISNPSISKDEHKPEKLVDSELRSCVADGADHSRFGELASGKLLASRTILIPLVIGNNRVLATVDTGAQATIVSRRLADKIGLLKDSKSQPTNLISAFEGPSSTGYRVRNVAMIIGRRVFHWDLIVADIIDDFLLGNDFLQQYGCLLNLNNGTLHVGDDLVKFEQYVQNGEPICVERVTSVRRTVIPPWSRKIVFGTFITGDNDYVVEPIPMRSPVTSPRVLVGPNSQVSLELVNWSDRFVTVKKGTWIGCAVPADHTWTLEKSEDVSSIREVHISGNVDTNLQVMLDTLPPHLYNLWENSCKLLSKEQSVRVGELLTSYADIFAAHEFDIGSFRGVQHRIDTRDAPPVRHRMRRTPIGFEQEEEAHLQKMLRAGVVEPSQSEWASAPVLVRKKDGSVRYCVDFRDLNSRTVKDAFPLPLIGECLDTLSGCQWFSTLDLASGYWQIDIHPDDRHKSAFITKHGLYEHKRMAFGLCNAPATFQRAMNHVLQGLTWRHALAYLDDVVVLAKTFEAGLDNLREVFDRFRNFDLKLKPKKCKLFGHEVDFLGRRVNREGVTFMDDKLTAIQAWPVPSNRKELEAWLGYMNYHRDFIPRYSHITDCLYQRARSKEPFCWEGRHQEAFDQLKKIASSSPFLVFPNKEDPFILDTDASDGAVGAELLQLQNGVERVVSHASKSLSQIQRRYCTTRKELLAVITFTRQFRHYLLGRRFTIRTDHSSLTWLTRFKKPEGQLARWLEELGQYDMQIIHRAGSKHGNADSLSRIPSGDYCPFYQPGTSLEALPCEGCSYCSRAHRQWERFELDVDDVVPISVRTVGATGSSEGIIGLNPYTKEDLLDYQEKDPNIAPIVKWLRTGINPEQSELSLCSPAIKRTWSQRPQLVLDGALFYRWEEPEGRSRIKLVIPETLKEEALRLAHDLTSAGHFGIAKTLAKLKYTFYWPQLYSAVHDYVTTCATCTTNKKAHRKAKAPLGSYHAGAPMQRLHIDIMGPFFPSERGNKYILMIIDQFTKWVECHAIPDQTAQKVCVTLIDNFISRFGIPSEIHSDQGKNFDGSLFRALCRALEISKTRTTPYHPSSNGQVERYNRTVLQAIRSYIGGNQRLWDVHLPIISMAVRSMVNRSTGYTANFLMLGREISLPDQMFGVDMANFSHGDAPEDVVQLLQYMRRAHSAARKNLQSCQHRQKQDYDHKLHHTIFERGDLVYKIDSASKVGQNNKLKSVFMGPFIVLERISPLLYRITGRKRVSVVHHDRIRQCKDRDIPLWVQQKRSQLLTDDSENQAGEGPSLGLDSGDRENEQVSLPEAEINAQDDLEPNKLDKNVSVLTDPQPPDAETSGLVKASLPHSTRSGRKLRRPAYLDNYVTY